MQKSPAPWCSFSGSTVPFPENRFRVFSVDGNLPAR
jgi:hypothetical protein